MSGSENSRGGEILAHYRYRDVEGVLRPLVTCVICMELYVDPVAFLDCLHLACGSCARKCLEYSTTCPQCRQTIRGTHDSHSTAAVVEAYQAIAPNSVLCQARTPEVVVALRQKYRIGQKMVPQQENGRTNAVSYFDLVSSDSTATPGRQSPASQPNATQFLHRATSCPCCDPNNTTGFVCPRLGAREHSDIGLRTIPFAHTTCAECCRLLPIRDDLAGSKCVVCTRTTCMAVGLLCPARGSHSLHLSRLRDVEFESEANLGLPFHNAFGDNRYERDLFKSYLDRSRLSLQEILQGILGSCGRERGPRRAAWHGRAFRESGSDTVYLDETVCTHCAAELVEANIFDWWRLKRTESCLPTSVMTRPDCPYGIECLAVRDDLDHAEIYNHICLATRRSRMNRETNNIRPEGSGYYIARSQDLSVAFPPYKPSQVTFRDKHKEPVFISSAVRQTDEGSIIIPGKTVRRSRGTTTHYGLNDREYEHDGTTHLLIDIEEMHWVYTSRGVIPEGCRPVVGGHADIGGVNQDLYHCAVWWDGQRIPGYTSPQLGRAVITWEGSMRYFENQYELLCWN